MPLPKAPGAAAAPETTEAPAAAPSAPAEEKRERKPRATFGPGRGEDAIPVPTNFGGENVDVDLVALLDNLNAAVLSAIPNIDAFLTVWDESVEKSDFPGNTDGRKAYKTGAIVKNIVRASSTKAAAGGRTSAAARKAAALEETLKKLAAALPAEQLEKLGIDLSSLT